MASSSTSRWVLILFGVSLAVLAAYQQLKLSPALPILRETYGYDPAIAGGFMSIYALAGLVLSLWLGRLMARFGLGRLIAVGFVSMILGSVLILAVPASGAAVLLGRGLEGVGYATLAIAGPAIATSQAGDRYHAVTSALIATWVPVGAIIANAIAYGWVDTYSWRLLWWASIVATLVMAGWSLRVRQRHPHALATPQRSADAGQQMWHPAPWQRQAQWLASGLFTLFTTQVMAYLTWLPTFLVEDRGLSPDQALLGFFLPLGAVIVFNLATAPMLRAGAPATILFMAAMFVKFLIWALLPITDGMAAGLISLFAFGISAGIAPTCLFAFPGVILGPGRAGPQAFGLLHTGRNLGVLVGPLMLGALVQATGSWSLISPVMSVLAALTILGGFVLHRMLRRHAPDAA